MPRILLVICLLLLLDRTLTIVLVGYKMVMAYLEWKYLGNLEKQEGDTGHCCNPNLPPYGEEKEW